MLPEDCHHYQSHQGTSLVALEGYKYPSSLQESFFSTHTSTNSIKMGITIGYEKSSQKRTSYWKCCVLKSEPASRDVPRFVSKINGDHHACVR